MQIVINIEEKIYNLVKSWNYPTDTAHRMLFELVTNGTPLPKGHGRIIDESDLIPDSDYEDGMFYAVSIGAINGAPTIIEADKAESEEYNCMACAHDGDNNICNECENGSKYLKWRTVYLLDEERVESKEEGR